jgi:hypothetical protein
MKSLGLKDDSVDRKSTQREIQVPNHTAVGVDVGLMLTRLCHTGSCSLLLVQLLGNATARFLRVRRRMINIQGL